MTRRRRLLSIAAITLSAALLLGSLWPVLWQPQPSITPAAPLAVSPEPTGAPRSQAWHGAAWRGADPLVQSLRRASDLRGALESARRQLAPDSPMLHSLTEETRVACSIVRRPDASARRVEGDPNRRVWIDQLLRRCAGLLDTDLAPPMPSVQALDQWNRELPLMAALRISLQAGDDLAWWHIANSADPPLIAESLRFLLDQQRLPLSEIFPGQAAPARADVEAALIYAADWIGCARSDSCAADGLWTLYTCAQFGCPAGSDLPRAYYRILPAHQYEVARRLVLWATRR